MASQKTGWQVRAYVLMSNHFHLAVPLLNLTDQDYQLNPLNLTPELPRERTLALRFRFAF